MSGAIIIPEFRYDGTSIVPRVSGRSLEMGDINAAATSANTIGTAGQTTFLGDGSSLTGVSPSIGDTITGSADQRVLFTNGTTLAQDALFLYDDSANTLRVGTSGTVNNNNSILSKVLAAEGVVSTIQLGSTTIQYEVANERGIVEMFKSSGVGNTYPDFQMLLTEASGVTSQIPFNVEQTASLIVLNEFDGSNVMDVQIQNGAGTSIVHVDSANLNVGVGTTTPDASAKLDVVSTTQGSRPAGTMTAAQASAIASPVDGLMVRVSDRGGKLFVYDGTNSQFESVETITLCFSENGAEDGSQLRYGFAANAAIGYIAPYAGTIKEVTALGTGGNATKQFDIEINEVLDTSFNLVASEYVNTNQNVTFASSDKLGVFCSAVGGSVTNPTVTLHVKWII